MSLELDTFALAEGAANDSRGNLSLISFNPQVLLVPSFPSSLAPVLVIIAVERLQGADSPRLAQGDEVKMRLVVSGPSGEVLFFAENGVGVNAFPDNDLPRRLQVVAQVPFTAGKAGDYTFTGSLSVPAKGLEVSANRVTRLSSDPNGSASS